MKIDAERFLTDIEELGEIGYSEGEGVTRLALSDEDVRAREWLIAKMEDAGLKVKVDAAGNVIGRMDCGDPDAKTFVIGSHLDTVPQGGKYDGALGVVGGLETARSLMESGVKLPWNLEVIDFTDEEGHHFAGTFGSRVMMGSAAREELFGSKAAGAPSLADSFQRLGWDPDKVDEARRDPAEFRGYLEMHVEQGGTLEQRGIDIGVVTGIVGIYRYVVEVEGQANHAGTTPMDIRRDALVAVAPVFNLLPEWARARSPEMVATIGDVTVKPGAMNIIPGLCRFTAELRSIEAEDMIRVRDRLDVWLDDHIPDSLMRTVYEKDGVYLDEQIMSIIESASDAVGVKSVYMPSGAGHDAQSFAPYLPTAMIFVPSHRGISHSPDEYTSPEQLVNGVRVMMATVVGIAEADRG
ncbi:MAG: Zn-dependent hydrolase [Bacillota bacterium]